MGLNKEMSASNKVSNSESVASSRTGNVGWKNYYICTLAGLKNIAEKMTKANNASNAGSTAGVPNSNLNQLDFLTAPLVLVASADDDISMSESLGNLKVDSIVAVNDGFIDYLLSHDNLSKLPVEVKGKLFLVSETFKKDTIISPLSRFSIPLFHSLNFFFRYATETLTPLKNFGTLYNFIRDTINSENTNGRGSAPFGYELRDGKGLIDSINEEIGKDETDASKKEKLIVELAKLRNSKFMSTFVNFDPLKEYEVALGELFEFISSKGICYVYEYLNYCTMPKEGKPKTFEEAVALQSGLTEGVGGGSIMPGPISFYSLLESKKAEMVRELEVLRSTDVSIEAATAAFNKIRTLMDESTKYVKDYDNKHKEEEQDSQMKKKEIIDTKEANKIILGQMGLVYSDAVKIYNKIRESRPAETKLVEKPGGPESSEGTKPSTISLAWIENWISNKFKDKISNSEKVDVKYKVSKGGNFEEFKVYDVIQTPGEGNCLISAILTAISPTYRKVASLEDRDAISVAFRSIIRDLQKKDTSALFKKEQKDDLCARGQFLSNDVGFKLANHLGLNLVYLVAYDDAKKTINVDPTPDIIDGANWILIYNTGAKPDKGDTGLHYEAVRAPNNGPFLSDVSALVADYKKKHVKLVDAEEVWTFVAEKMAQLKNLHDQILAAAAQVGKDDVEQEEALKQLNAAKAALARFDLLIDDDFKSAASAADTTLYTQWRTEADAAIQTATTQYNAIFGKKPRAPVEPVVAPVEPVVVPVVPNRNYLGESLDAWAKDVGGKFEDYYNLLKTTRARVYEIAESGKKENDRAKIEKILTECEEAKRTITIALTEIQPSALGKLTSTGSIYFVDLQRNTQRVIEDIDRIIRELKIRIEEIEAAAAKKAANNAAAAKRAEEEAAAAKRAEEEAAASAAVGGGAAGETPAPPNPAVLPSWTSTAAEAKRKQNEGLAQLSANIEGLEANIAKRKKERNNLNLTHKKRLLKAQGKSENSEPNSSYGSKLIYPHKNRTSFKNKKFQMARNIETKERKLELKKEQKAAYEKRIAMIRNSKTQRSRRSSRAARKTRRNK